MSEININGKKYQGKNIIVIGGKVIIDGKSAISEKETVINITVNGDVNSIQADYCEKISVIGNVEKINAKSEDILVKGNVHGSVECKSGDIEIEGSVGGNVSSTAGDINCKDVGGSVNSSSGDITCKTVSGNVTSKSGDIYK